MNSLFVSPPFTPVVNPPGNWSVLQNITYFLVIVATILVTLGILWIVKKIRGEKSAFEPGISRQTEIHLIFEETLSAADRALVRDGQVREATRYLLSDPALAEPLEQWREKRREWASHLAFLESLGKNPPAETLNDEGVADSLRHLHSLALELEAAQRTMLRAVRQSVATGGGRPPLGTDSDS